MNTKDKFRIVSNDRIIGGVFAGLGRYAEVNPNILRAGYLIVTIVFPIPGIAAYGVLYYLFPKEQRLYE